MLGSMDPAELRELAVAAREALARRDAAILQAAREDLPQIDIAEATGLSKERIRQMERQGGVPPRRQGRRHRAT